MVGSGGDRRFGLERPEVVEAIVRDAVPEEWRNEAVPGTAAPGEDRRPVDTQGSASIRFAHVCSKRLQRTRGPIGSERRR
jgi:hypothetical protein